jgi:predicted deacetylase
MIFSGLESKYLIRFDDIHECMNWEMWDQIEEILDMYKIRPLVAVIPRNRDSSLSAWPKNNHYKDRYLSMKNKGYEMCQHGYDHVYISAEPGLFGLSPRSEFAGIDPLLQEEKIVKGKNILKDLQINPRCWIGPNHSYDQNTIDILKRSGFTIISDGLHRLPYMYDEKIMLIPSQKWEMKSFFPGLFTICYHHNNWDGKMLAQFERDVIANRSKIVQLDDVIDCYQGRKKTLFDGAFSVTDKFVTHYLKGKLRGLIR